MTDLELFEKTVASLTENEEEFASYLRECFDGFSRDPVGNVIAGLGVVQEKIVKEGRKDQMIGLIYGLVLGGLMMHAIADEKVSLRKGLMGFLAMKSQVKKSEEDDNYVH